MVTESLVAFERKLQNSAIIRVHRSFLANINSIKELEPWFNSTYNLIMTNGEKVPLGAVDKMGKEPVSFPILSFFSFLIDF
jgi:DNA-binding LytR/AlgR family response regulator